MAKSKGKAKAKTKEKAKAKAKITTPGGSPFQVYHNLQMAAKKQVASPDELGPSGALTADARRAAEDGIKARWAAMSADDKQIYTNMFRGRLQERKRLAEEVAAAGGPERESTSFELDLRSHWGLGSRACSVSPCVVKKFFDAGGKMPPKSEVYDESEYRVAEMPGGRVLEPQCQHIIPCGARGRNMCRMGPNTALIDEIIGGFNRFVRKLGKVRAKGGDVLICCEAQRPRMADAGPKPRYFLFLSNASFNPMFQDFTWCKVADGSSTDADTETPPYPIDLQVDIGRSRLLVPGMEDQECLRHCTSDELAAEMARVGEMWSVGQVDYTDISALVVRAIGPIPEMWTPCHTRGAADSANSGQNRELLSALRAFDMMQRLDEPRRQSGRHRPERATAARRPPASSRLVQDPSPPAEALQLEEEGHAAGSLGPQGDKADWESEDDDPSEAMVGVVGGLEIPLLEFGLREAPDASQLHRGVGEDDNDLVVADPSDPAEECSDEVRQLTDDAAQLIFTEGGLMARTPEEPVADPSSAAGAVVDASAHGPRTGPEEKNPTAPALQPQGGGEIVAGAPAGWAMTKDGYVFDEHHRRIGRITKWRTSISAKCYLHSGKCSMAKPQKSTSEGTLMRWLKMGVDIPNAASSSSSSSAAPPPPPDLTAAHMALWNKVAK